MDKQPHQRWTEKISKWENVSVDEYKLIFDLAKERFEDVLSETESITDKSIKIFTAAIVFCGFLVGIITQNKKFHLPILWIDITIGLITSTIFFVVIVIWPRGTRRRGLPPIVSTTPNFDNDEDKGYLLQKLYYNCIGVFQDNIDLTISRNKERIIYYNFVQVSFVLLLIVMAVDLSFIF